MRRAEVLRVVMAVAFVAAIAESAAAQPLPWRVVEGTSAGWTLTPGAAFGIAWDSGVQTGSHPVIEAIFQKYVGRVTPHAEIDFRGRRTSFNAGYSGALEKYWGSGSGYEQHSQLSVSHVVSSRFSTSANASYAAAPASDRLLLDVLARPNDPTLPYVDVSTSYVTAGGAFQYRASPRITIDGGYHYRDVRLDRDASLGPLEVLRDGRAHIPSLQIMRAFTPRLSIGTNLEYRREEVGDAFAFDVQTAAAAFTYRATSTTTINAGGGVSRLMMLGDLTTTMAPTFYAGFDQRRRRFEIRGNYARGFHQLYGFGDLVKSDSVSAGVTAPLLERRYYLSALVAYSRSRGVEDLGIDFDLNTTWTNAAVGRRLNDWLSAEAYLSVSLQTSSVRGDSDRTRFGVQFVTSAPLRMD